MTDAEIDLALSHLTSSERVRFDELVGTSLPVKLKIEPQPAQIPFIECTADIAGFGGAAGAGKSIAQLINAAKNVHIPGFGAVLFRKTSEDIRKTGALWDSARELFAHLPAKPREQMLDFTFPSGATISLEGLPHDSDVYNFQGAQICLMGFDEANHFSRFQFWYMFSRNRSACGVDPTIRLTFNPDPDSYLFELFGPWVDEEHPLFPASPGDILYFVREVDNKIRWVDGRPDRPVCIAGDNGERCLLDGCDNCFPPEKSITYFPSNVFDNRELLKKNPGYLASLKALDEIDRNRLLHGLWTHYQKEGALWKREMFQHPGFRVPAAEWYRDENGKVQIRLPAGIVKVVVAIDPSVSDPEKAKNPNKKPDECGLIVGGVTADGHGVVLADFTDIMSPAKWAKLAVKLYGLFRASSIIAEANNGGELIREVIRGIAPNVPVTLVHASLGKRPRAEPVSALYETKRFHHAGEFPKLEAQMCSWDASNLASKSPGRVDSLAWLAHGLGLCQITGMKFHDRLKPRQ